MSAPARFLTGTLASTMRFLSFLPPWLDPILPAHLDRRPKIFKDRPDDLLCWDLEAEPSWDKLCAFLDVPVPTHDFPHGKQQTWS
jgi:hypothetical protein